MSRLVKSAFGAAAVLSAACVTTGTYDAKVAELEGIRSQHDAAAAQRQKELQGQIDALHLQVADLTTKKGDLDKQVAALTTERDGLRKQLDDTTALVGELKKRLEKLGQNVEKLTSEKGQISGALSDAKARLDELRKQKEAADALAATFKGLVQKLKSMIDSGQLKVVIRDGRMLIALPNDVLFDSGRVDLKPDAKLTLTKVAQALATIDNRHFLVAGHTDNVPIHTARFASNWDLSTGRAVEVTKFLVAQGMKPQVLAAAGYGEFDPVEPNDTPEHRALNRRIEIVLQPNLSELPSLEGLVTTSQR
jgi:chemotaxis protein MotB